MGVYGVPLPDDGSSFGKSSCDDEDYDVNNAVAYIDRFMFAVPPLVLTCIAWIEEHAITAEGEHQSSGQCISMKFLPVQECGALQGTAVSHPNIRLVFVRRMIFGFISVRMLPGKIRCRPEHNTSVRLGCEWLRTPS